ncbi:MAG: hypothetical protein ACKN87_13110 [Microcystis aeruginosa]
MKSLASARKHQGRHRLDIDVYLCPIDKNKYSFAINKNGGVRAFYQFESDPYLSGCYESIEEALEAGIKEATNRLSLYRSLQVNPFTH